MASRDNDTALWLHNKLGSTDDLWSGRSISSQLTKEKLVDILRCFRSLQAHVKVKLLLSFLHVVRRNVAEWKVDMEHIIQLAMEDRDQWVSTTGEIMKDYPETFLVNTTDLTTNSTFHSMYTELKKTVKKSTESNTLPLECVCLGKNALVAAINQQPHRNKHFSLKRKPKSSALRDDLLIKSQEIQSSTKRGLPVGNIPMKVRSSAKRMDDEIASRVSNSSQNGLSNTGFLKANTLSSFNSVHRNPSSLSMRKEGGAKMLDISEMPPTGKEAKRRKKLEEQEAAAQAKKEREEALAAEKAAAAEKATPDYAAGLGGNSTAAIKTARAPVSRISTPATTTPSYLPNITPRLPTEPPSPSSCNVSDANPYCYHPYMMAYMNTRNYGLPAAGYARDLGNTTNLTAGTMQGTGPITHSAPLQPTIRARTPASSIQPRPVPQHIPVQTTTPAAAAPAAVPQIVSRPNPISTQPAAVQQQPNKKPLSLTKEQMVEAQEMFKNSNKVTRPEKALILGFMAGSRDNPCPQQGHIVNIRLSEKIEPVRLNDSSIREMISETFFQMNYQTGEWRRIKKFKETSRGGAPPTMSQVLNQ